MSTRPRLAIVGTGIAGMACAYFLRERYAISVFEKNSYVGGHTNTVDVNRGASAVPVDTGFMVYNDQTYPNLIRFFDLLGIEAMDTDMSFGLRHERRNLEMSFSDARGFFAQKRRWLSPSHWRLLSGIKKFFQAGHEFLEKACPEDELITLEEFARKHDIPPSALECFVVPMTGAIWSTPPDRMLEYPALTLLRFLANHGMLGIGTQFQWKTLEGGSRQYRDKVVEKIGPFLQTGNGATRVERSTSGVSLVDQRGQTHSFDKVIIASHADEALALLGNPLEKETKLLGAFAYNENPCVLHSDDSVMPRSRNAWASWNYRYDDVSGGTRASTHYWMNRLQGVPGPDQYFVSVDYHQPIDESKIHWRTTYHHPRFDATAIRAQPDLPSLNDTGPIYFCGSYFRYGFHEDAFTSGIDLCQRLLEGKEVWEV